MTDLYLSPDAMRFMVRLRRLLDADHHIRVDLEADGDPCVRLMDATRECRDRHADRLAGALCDALTDGNPASLVQALRERLKPGFSPPLHERQVGFRPGRVYRGQRIRDAGSAESAADASSGEGGDDRRAGRRVLVYRGQKRVT